MEQNEKSIRINLTIQDAVADGIEQRQNKLLQDLEAAGATNINATRLKRLALVTLDIPEHRITAIEQVEGVESVKRDRIRRAS